MFGYCLWKYTTYTHTHGCTPQSPWIPHTASRALAPRLNKIHRPGGKTPNLRGRGSGGFSESEALQRMARVREGGGDSRLITHGGRVSCYDVGTAKDVPGTGHCISVY